MADIRHVWIVLSQEFTELFRCAVVVALLRFEHDPIVNRVQVEE